MSFEKNVFWHATRLTLQERNQQNEHQACVIWFTGLSGSGKSTLAYSLEQSLFKLGVQSFVLDGDNIRHGLNKDLGFETSDRKENIRRVAEVSKLFASAGMIVIVSFISPYQEDRQWVRQLINPNPFVEIYLDCPIDVCEERDTKGLYLKARQGLIPNFTGIGDIYEPPLQPELIMKTHLENKEKCLKSIIDYLNTQKIISV